MTAPLLRLLADDLTGALDSAARFVPLTGAVPTVWSGAAIPAGSAAIDAGTRDGSADDSVAAMARWLPALAGAGIAFKKIDSLLRGHVRAELAACLPAFDQCVLAPAFPFQGRVTRHSRHYRRDGGAWVPVGPVDLPVPLRDAETDADLDRIVAEGRRLDGRVLWCGTAGLAGALAGRHPVPCPDLPRPMLALIGSDHAVTQAQIAAAAGLHHLLPPRAAVAVTAPAIVTVAVPAGADRATAHRLIVRTFADVLARGRRPGTLLVSGGKTLRGLCDALGASRLDVDGEVEPGVPTSILRGGAWDGQRVVSKSGAFGGPEFLARLFARGT